VKRILITGASGFVGAVVARRALQEGHETHLLLRPSHQCWRVEGISRDVQIHSAELENEAEVRRMLAEVRPEWVFHLAAYGAYSYQTGMARMIATNLVGCVSLLDASVQAGAEVFLQTGSSSEYGWKDHPPDEAEFVDPNSHYAITKAAATQYCRQVALAQAIRAVTLRLYSIYGPYEEPTRLIPSLLLHGMRGMLPPLVSASTARDFVYVDDAVEAMFAVARAESIPKGAVYNVASGVQTTLGELVSVVRNLLGVTVEPQWATMEQRSWDTNVWVGTAERIRREIGWSARTGLESGLRQTLEWLERHPDLLRHYEASLFKG